MKRFAALGFALLSACATSESVLPPVGSHALDGRDAVIVAHGYYGSALREQGGGTREFIRVSTILFGSFPIGLASEELGTLPSAKMEVEGLISAVPVMPGIYGIDVYGAWLEKLARPSLQVIPFSYDWRGDLPQAAAELGTLVRKIRAAGAKRVTIFAHSMGGLVTTYYLAYGEAPLESATADWQGARLVNAVAYFGTPFRGTASVLRNMQHGTGYPWNKDLLQSGTVASFPASYQLLPFGTPLLQPDGKPHGLEISDPANWEPKKMGLFRDAPAATLPARRAYSAREVARAVRLQRLLLEAPSPPPALRILNVVGVGEPTLATGYVRGDRLIFLPEEAEDQGLPFAVLETSGDGTVTVDSARLPAGLTPGARQIESSLPHQKLFLDPTVEKEYENLLKPN